MANYRSARDPFAVKLSAEQRKDLTAFLCDEIEQAQAARMGLIQANGDLDYAHWLYEQGRTPPEAKRWPDAADLNSYLVTEKVDALRSRIVKTIFAEPFSIVEGWGQDAQKAPFVEAFHDWKRRDEQLRWYLSIAIHNALIEQNGILEVLDKADLRKVTKIQQYLAQTAADGTVVLDEKNQPSIAKDERDQPIPVTDPDRQPMVKAAVQSYELVRKGPGYRVISQRDFLLLPGQATDQGDLWGYAKRCWVRVPTLKERAKAGIYDEQAVAELSGESDRTDLTPSLIRSGQTLAPQLGPTAEKELWEVLFLSDLDGDGIEEWVIATVSVMDRVLLRVRKDDLGYPRYQILTPFPRPDSVYGYSFVLDKIATLAEEHTAQRNMAADRSQLATNPPLKRRTGGLWMPSEQPWGTGAVIDVRDMEEVQPFVVPDVPQSTFVLQSMTLQAAERVTGINDTAVGVQTQEQRTATEVQNVAVAGAVRVEEVVENIQATLERLDLIRNEIWIRTLEQHPDQGAEAPETVVRQLQVRQLTLPDGRFTAQMLRGNFRFKPHGSVETADKNRMRADFNGSLQALGGILQMFPPAMALVQSPDVLKAILLQWARLYNVPDQQPFIDALDRMAQAQQIAQQMGGMRPGQPPGSPPLALPGGVPPELLAMLQAGGVQ